MGHTLRSWRLLVLPAAVGTAVYFAWVPLEPDASYYVGGISLFPSPVGTLVGTAGGYTGLDILNAASTGAILILVALIALELGRQPMVAQGLALLLVRGDWFQNSTMDTPGVMLLLAAALLHLRGRRGVAIAFAGIGAATHLATLPLALGAILADRSRRRSARLVVALSAAGVCIALLTSYRAGFRVLVHPSAFAEGARELALVCWPLLLLSPVAALQSRARCLFAGSAGGAIVAGAVPAAVGQLNITRYAVPCLFLPAAALGLRRPFYRLLTRRENPARA